MKWIAAKFSTFIVILVLVVAACNNPQPEVRLNKIPRSILQIEGGKSEFGFYYRRMAERIDRKWRQLLYDMESFPEFVEDISIRFFIDEKGRVDLLEVERFGISEALVGIAIESIEGSAPFQPWTKEMKEKLTGPLPCKITYHFVELNDM